DEQASDQHLRQGGQEFHRRLARLFVHRLSVNVLANDSLFFFFRHVRYPVLENFFSAYQLEGSRPAGFVKEVNDDVGQKSQPVTRAAHLVLVRRSDERPVHEHRAADHVLPRNEAPITAVVAHVAVVTHGKVTIWRHDDVSALQMRRQFLRPFFVSHPVHVRRWHRREIVTVRVVISEFVLGVLLLELLAIAVDDAIAQVDAISRHAHDPFHHEQALFLRRQEHNNVVAADIAIREQRPHPKCRLGELLPVHEYVVADEQRVLHGTGGNLKRLEHERDDEQSGDQHSRQGSQKFHRRFARFFFHCHFFFFFFRHVWYPFQKISSHRTSSPHLPTVVSRWSLVVREPFLPTT